MGSESFITIFFQIKHNLIPPFIHFKGHRALKRFYSGNGLVIAGNKLSFHPFIVQNTNLEPKIFLHLKSYNIVYIFH
jgi:hypothetical protein